MNERLIELAMQANSHTGNSFDLNHKELDVFLEKFAELIVRECADIADINQHQWNGAGSYVKKHFGFE